MVTRTTYGMDPRDDLDLCRAYLVILKETFLGADATPFMQLLRRDEEAVLLFLVDGAAQRERFVALFRPNLYRGFTNARPRSMYTGGCLGIADRGRVQNALRAHDTVAAIKLAEAARGELMAVLIADTLAAVVPAKTPSMVLRRPMRIL